MLRESDDDGYLGNSVTFLKIMAIISNRSSVTASKQDTIRVLQKKKKKAKIIFWFDFKKLFDQSCFFHVENIVFFRVFSPHFSVFFTLYFHQLLIESFFY